MANPTPHSSSANNAPTTTETNTPNIPRVHTSYQPHGTVNNTNTLGKYNYYQALELPNFASIEQVKTAYRELAKRWHPDFHLESSTLAQIAEERFKAINMAYVTLKSPETKALYDEKLRLLLDKIARYIEKREKQTSTVVNTVPTVVQQPHLTPATTNSMEAETSDKNNPTKTPTPSVKTINNTPNVFIPLTETLPSPVQTEPVVSSHKKGNNHEETGVEKTAKRLRHISHGSKTTLHTHPQTTVTAQPNNNNETSNNTITEQLTPTPVPLSVRKEPLSANTTVTPNTQPKLTADAHTHFDFLQKLRNYLQPNVQPVVLCYAQEKSSIEVEGILTITPQQAKAGKSIRVQLDASHCEKFNLPPIIQVHLPKYLEEGHRLKITEDKWYNNQTDTAKIISLPEADTQQALILVVHIQEKPKTLLSMMSDTLNKIIPKPKASIRSSEANQATPTMVQAIASNGVLPDKITNPTVLSECIQIPLPLAVLGGPYEFTSQVTQEKISIHIPSGVSNNTQLHVGITNDTLLNICITWQLPEAKILSKQEKHLYETLLLTAFTTGKRQQSTGENTPNTENLLKETSL
jgi:hypothetical protein